MPLYTCWHDDVTSFAWPRTPVDVRITCIAPSHLPFIYSRLRLDSEGYRRRVEYICLDFIYTLLLN